MLISLSLLLLINLSLAFILSASVLGGSKKVAIIGAGPAGIVSARHLLKYGFSPRIFEKSSSIGGMWDPKSRRIWQSMKTNLSKYTCSFSELHWNRSTDVFPSQNDVYSYLLQYSERFIPPEHFTFQSKIVNVEKSNDCKWVVHWINQSNQEQSDEFENVIISTGYYSDPVIPSLRGLETFQGSIIHSNKYNSPEIYNNKKVAVIGSTSSAVEISADVATHAEEVINIRRRHTWVIPRWIPLQPSSPNTPFLPIDTVFYRYSSRQSLSEVIFKNEAHYLKTNTYLASLTSNHQSANPLPSSNSYSYSNPPYVAISDTFASLLQSNIIKLEYGNILSINNHSIVMNDGNVVNNIDDIILCTGYKPNLSFLSNSILEKLSYDPEDSFQSLLLHRCMIHPELRGLAFVGMYRAPYFAIMELQAVRLLILLCIIYIFACEFIS